MTMKPGQLRVALRAVASVHDGVLQAEDVVDAARDPGSPLHGWFAWDDTDAARRYRLHQARTLIRYVARIEYADERYESVRVSLREDRRQPGGGYRLLADVLAHDSERQQLLAEAKADMVRFTRRYRSLVELADVLAHMHVIIDSDEATVAVAAGGTYVPAAP